MKNSFCFSRYIFKIFLTFFSFHNLSSQITVAPTGSKSILDIVSTTKGIITPRMTENQKNNISAPAVGLLIFQIDGDAGYYFYTGSNWKYLSTLVLLEDVDRDTKVQVEKNTDEDKIRFDLGGAEHVVIQKNAAGDGRVEFTNNTGAVLIGNEAGKNTSATNFAIGDSSLMNTTTGSNNFAIGKKTLFSNITGKDNFAIGSYALTNTTVDSNFAVGYQALKMNTLGSKNLALGFESLLSNVDGNNNYGIGYHTLRSNISGNRNIAIGTVVLKDNTTGDDNIGICNDCFENNSIGSRNTILGANNVTMNSNLDGYDNVAIGKFTMEDAVSNYRTVAVGYDAMRNLTTGLGNTAIGNSSHRDMIYGENNTAFGNASLLFSTTGSRNVTFGSHGLINFTGSNNTQIGTQANNFVISTKTGITTLGAYGYANADNVTLIGYNPKSSTNVNTTNATAIGNFQEVNDPNTISIGIADFYRVGIGTTTPDTHAILDIVSTTRGFLPPRGPYSDYYIMLSAEPGLIKYDTDLRALFFRYNSTPYWRQLNNVFDGMFNPLDDSVPVWRNGEWILSSTNKIEDADGDTKILIDEYSAGDEFTIRLEGTERMRIKKNVNGKYLTHVYGDNNCMYIGSSSGEFASSAGVNNVGIGFSTLKNSNALGSYNTAIGTEALITNVGGAENVAIGSFALQSNTQGSHNVAIGKNALQSNTTGDYNVAIGNNSGDFNTTQDYITTIGHNADVTSDVLSNSTAIGNYSRPNASNTLILGKIEGVNGATVSDKVGLGTTTPEYTLHIKRDGYGSNPMILLEEPTTEFSRIKFRTTAANEDWAIMGRANATVASARFNFFYNQTNLSLQGNGDVVLTNNLYENSDKRLKRKIQRIKFDWNRFQTLRPVTYFWKNENNSVKQQLGFIAQEIQNLYPSLISKNEGLLVLNYQGFVPILIEGVKHLDNECEIIENKIHEAKKILAEIISSNHQNK